MSFLVSLALRSSCNFNSLSTFSYFSSTYFSGTLTGCSYCLGTASTSSPASLAFFFAAASAFFAALAALTASL